MSHHPSPLMLDMFVLKRDDAEIARHLTHCAQCSAFVAERELWAEEPLPPALRARTRPVAAPRRLWLFALPATAAAVLYLSTADDVTRPKAAPAVDLYIARDSVVRPWNGRELVRAGDRLQLTLAPEDLGHVAVATRTGSSLRFLYRGRAETDASGRVVLPMSFDVDDAPGGEWIAVVFSRHPLDESALSTAVSRTRRDADVWVTTLDLQKELP